MIDQAAIQIKGEASRQIAEHVASFLAGGGQIHEAAPLQYTPKPLTVHSQTANLKRAKKAKDSNKVSPGEKREAYVAQLREMAKTMTQAQAAETLGVSKRGISGMSNAHNIEFRPGRGEPDRSHDVADCARIRACIKLGVTRNAAMASLKMSFSHISRLLDEYDIEYPTQKRTPR